MGKINTTDAVADRLGTSVRRVQQLIKELEIVPIQVIGKSMIISNADVRRLERRKRTPGPAKGKK